MPFFSVIAAYYQGVTDDAALQRFTDSLAAQGFQDFELLLFHDGPLLRQVACPYPIRCTAARRNVWGHNLRQLGLRLAKGEYILHTNADNEYLPDAFAAIHARLRESPRDILIAQAQMMGLNRAAGRIWYDRPRDYSKSVLLSGDPPVFGNIDLMQLVARREVWQRHGWPSLIEQADGLIYPRLCQEHGYACADIVIGRHY